AASSGANIGTALHAFTEAVDAGRPVTIPAPWDADVAAYTAALQAADVAVDPAYIETVLALHSIEVAGTMDRLVTMPDGRRLIADLKTGKDLSYGWGEIAIQLALYAHAEQIFDVATGQYRAMPEVDRSEALVMHLPAGQARCDLYLVDIAAGWEAVEIAMRVRSWRKRRDLATLLPAAALAPAAAAVVDEPTTGEEPATEELRQARRAWLQGRIDDMPVDAKRCLARNWPTGMATLKASGDHTDDDLAAISEVISAVEREFRLTFPEPEPRAEVPAPPPAEPLPPRSAPEPLPPAAHGEVTAVVERLKVLPGDLLAEVEAAALAEGVPNLLSGRATDEQLAIVEELLVPAEGDLTQRRLVIDEALAGYIEDDAVVAALVAASSPHGHSPERLTAWEVEVLVAIVAGIEAGQLGINYGTGEPSIVAVGDIEAALVGRFATRGAALVALKATAEALGQPKPRSVAAAVTTSPVLAAVAVHVDASATTAA
ncbi:MAG TPA: PD-(D/E)XK nuclease family protein, partial [Mycolicibacterium fallax]|nr:PD-(D/E)XK nuclease family protein [Mycolicibacterium fallax]